MMDRLFPLTELLVLRSQAGDREAYGTLAELWQPVLAAHARRLCEGFGGRGAGWAEEATQEAWLSIARGIGGLDDPRAFGAWAMRIVARRVADRVRRARRERRRGGGRTISEEPADTAGADPRKETVSSAALRLALHAARPDDRGLLTMAYGRGMSIAAIADALGVSEGTVKSRLSRARRRLRSHMERNG